MDAGAKIEPARRTPRERIAELEIELARERAISEALRDVGVALGSTLDLDQLLELILGKTSVLLGAERATLYLVDEARGELVSRIVTGGAVRSVRLEIGQGIAGYVARTGKSVRLRDARRDRRFDADSDQVPGFPTRSLLAAPLKNHLGRCIGVVQLLNKQGGGGFDDDDETLLSAFATQAAVSIDNSRLFLSVIQKNMQLLETKELLEARVRDLKLLFELESATARATTMDGLVRAVLVEATAACGARAGAVLVSEEETGDLVAHFIGDDAPGVVRHASLKTGEGLIGWAMARGEIVRSDDVTDDPRSSSRADELIGFRPTSALAIPLEGEDGAPMGAIALYDKRGDGGWNSEDEALLNLVGANAATAIRLFLARAAHEREQRMSTIGGLLSGVVHDLKTPMTVIQGYVEMMASARSVAERRACAGRVAEQLAFMSAMQREVLEFARGERTLLVRKVYLARFFADLVEQVRREVDGRGVEVVLTLHDTGTARFDERKIARAVHNLARNAIEAMGERGGTLTLDVSRAADGALVICVEDTGPGIPKEIERRLFRSFVTAGKAGGTGLGLAIVKKIAEEHGGHVEVRSSPHGTRFTLLLPKSEAPR